MTLGPIAPHAKLNGYYTHEHERAQLVRTLFDDGAPHYELVCRMMSLGTGEHYRARALMTAGLAAGMRILDVATGTGIMLRSAATVTGKGGMAVGLDPSPGMLRECRKHCAAPVLLGRGEFLPFPDHSFDMVSMGYGLRHVTDLRSLFDEFHRVLKPGGRVLVLEISDSRTAIGRRVIRLYLRTLIPAITGLITGTKSARRMMDYFWATIENCVKPEVIIGALRESGFGDAVRQVTGGILSEYSGTSEPN